MCPVRQDQERAIERARHVGRDAQRVLRVVEARRGIRVGADAQAERGEELVDALAGEVLCALELHVLDEVREPQLVGVLQRGTGLDDQAQLRLAGRLPVRAHVEPQPVLQSADQHFRIDRHLPREAVGRDRVGGGLPACWRLC